MTREQDFITAYAENYSETVMAAAAEMAVIKHTVAESRQRGIIAAVRQILTDYSYDLDCICGGCGACVTLSTLARATGVERE